MKTIVLLRHSEAETKKTGMTDWDRNLTEAGTVLAKKSALALKEHVQEVDLCVYSPAQRTRHTAEIFCSLLLCKDKLGEKALYYNFDFDHFFDLIFALDDSISTVLFVGHNPFITRISMYLTDKYDLFLHPASFTVCRFDVNSWIEVNKGKLKDYAWVSSK